MIPDGRSQKKIELGRSNNLWTAGCAKFESALVKVEVLEPEIAKMAASATFASIDVCV